MPFLAHLDPRPLTLTTPEGIRPEALFVGPGGQALEVALCSATRRAGVPELRGLHNERKGSRAAPVIIVVVMPGQRASLAVTVPGDIYIAAEVDASQAERLCAAALAQPDRHAALRFLAHTLPQMGSRIPGLRNAGLFALHELEAGVPSRADWQRASASAKPALAARGRRLIEQIGFIVQETAGPASILVARDTKVAIALFLERADEIEAASPRFGGTSPITHALAKADQENLDYVVMTAGSSVRVYPVKPGVGVGRRARTETFVELNLDLLAGDQAAYLWLLCSADALAPGGTFLEILGTSADYAAALGTRLRERVYQNVMPRFAATIASQRKLRKPSPEKLRETYEMALLVLFRLLFTAYAEDKELLPLHVNPEYTRHSLKELAKGLAAVRARNTELGEESFYWNEIVSIWKAVDKGNRAWGVPAYNGGLFAADEGAGAALADIELPDAAFGPALAALLLEQTDEHVEGPIDFRSLGVREFGTVYEGLLESELSVAESDLAVDRGTLAYVPAKGDAEVVVEAGAIYLHNASGARKSSGAYYTKEFAVEHLLDKALEPALKEHLDRVSALYDAREASATFFQFHVADIAMGSGHFLVAAIDRIERRFSSYLAERPLPGVTDELERLRRQALEQLGADWPGDPIEDTLLLRRQIARRCVFGVDLNPLAVELARLSIWIHTFVPGLPLSFLDANLVIGNSLVGIATLEEAREVLEFEDKAGSFDLFGMSADTLLGAAREPLARLGRLAEATAAEIREARKLHAATLKATSSTADLFTVLTASRISDEVRAAVESRIVSSKFDPQGDVFSDALVRKAEKALVGLDVLHFPIVFPQVFLGKRGGFDVIIGNPPWEEATVEEDAFLARHFPGLRSLPQREQEARKAQIRRQRPDLIRQLEEATARADRLRALLTSGPYPGMGTGDPDVYKAFCWRFWNLLSPDSGRLGVVLPRSAVSAKGSAEFRLKALLAAKHVDVTLLVNSKKWVFPGVHAQYVVALVCAARGKSNDATLALRGPYATLPDYKKGAVSEPMTIAIAELRSWNDSAALPIITSARSSEVFAKLRKTARLDLNAATTWRARPQTELHATNDKPWMDLKSEEPPKGFWPVYKGESFDLWNNDTGVYYAWAKPEPLLKELLERRQRSGRKADSAFAEFPESWRKDRRSLACLSPRIAFRDVTNRLNERTMIAALVPSSVFLSNSAPYLVWPRGDTHDEAFLLGALCSLPLDWYARRFVERHANFFVFNPFPIPRVSRDAKLWQRAVSIAGSLAAQDDRLETWATKLRTRTQRLRHDEKEDLVHELDANMSLLYNLDEPDLVHIFETFHEGWDYQDRLDATLKHFARLKKLK